MAKRNAVSWLLLALALVCLGGGLFPWRNGEADPASGYHVTEWTVGLPFSPLYRSLREKWVQPGGAVSVEESGVKWLSGSALLVLCGVGCLGGWLRYR
jgi:hypothetical protein